MNQRMSCHCLCETIHVHVYEGFIHLGIGLRHTLETPDTIKSN